VSWVVLSEAVAILFACYLTSIGGLLRTQLQKILYFASQKGIIRDSYGRGYYGPFSSDVANSAESLVSANFLNEAIEFFPQGIGYKYSLINNLREVIPKLKEQTPNRVVEELSKVVELCQGRTTLSLSIAAKVHYVLKKMNAPMSAEEITAQAEKLKWNISPDEVLDASTLLKELGLIK